MVGALLSLYPQPQTVERQIEDRRCVEREQLTQNEPSHNRDAKGPAEFKPHTGPQRQRQSAQ
jgi:hypothetical protein